MGRAGRVVWVVVPLHIYHRCTKFGVYTPTKHI